jgi:hypothetical protein
MISLINYVIREPSADGHKIGYKYPFNAAEILSGDNTALLDRFFEDSNLPDKDEYEVLDETVKENPIEEKKHEIPALTTDEEVESIVKGVQDIEITSVNSVNDAISSGETNSKVETDIVNQVIQNCENNPLSSSESPVPKVSIFYSR